MEEITLEVQVRNQDSLGTSASKQIRREGFIPGIVYGGKEFGPTAIKTDRKNFESIARKHQGESLLFHLNVVENDKKIRDYSAIIKEMQFDPVSDKLVHIDFARISLKDEIEVKVHINLIGEAIGVKKEGGAVDLVLRELDVICLPISIPQHIDVDISHLKLHDVIHVGDLQLPSGVRTEHDSTAVIVSILGAQREDEAEQEEGSVELEVIKEKKEAKES